MPSHLGAPLVLESPHPEYAEVGECLQNLVEIKDLEFEYKEIVDRRLISNKEWQIKIHTFLGIGSFHECHPPLKHASLIPRLWP